MRKIYNPYKKWGIRRVINAYTYLTRLGGSIPPQEVFRDMEEASKCFVHIPELQQWAGKVIAEATGAEAGLPTAGASNSILLAAAACIMNGTELENYDPLEQETWTHIIQRLPLHTEGLKTEFIVQKANWSNYNQAVECAGGRFINVGTEDGVTEEELDEAFNPEKTAAYYHTLSYYAMLTTPSFSKCLPVDVVIRVAHRNEVPVIVDIASELPPKKNLKTYISKGADLVAISGGKFLSGPNNSGILAGRKNLIKLAHLQAYPFHGIGRIAKMSRETIVGFITALRIYMELDEKALFKTWENKARWIAEKLNKLPGVHAHVTYQNSIEENEPVIPLCCAAIEKERFGVTGMDLSNKLREGDPSIEVPYRERIGKIQINPIYLLEGDEFIICQRIKEIFYQS